MTARPPVRPPARLVVEFLTHLEKERGQSPHTLLAYRRDLVGFLIFCDRYYGGDWDFSRVDRLEEINRLSQKPQLA